MTKSLRVDSRGKKSFSVGEKGGWGGLSREKTSFDLCRFPSQGEQERKGEMPRRHGVVRVNRC